jgi:hypothetical protein
VEGVATRLRRRCGEVAGRSDGGDAGRGALKRLGTPAQLRQVERVRGLLHLGQQTQGLGLALSADEPAPRLTFDAVAGPPAGITDAVAPSVM